MADRNQILHRAAVTVQNAVRSYILALIFSGPFRIV